MPERIQRHRIKGWRTPEGAVIVTRAGRHRGKWGNPFRVADLGAFPDPQQAAVDMFADWLATTDEGRAVAARARAELRGKDLCCYCKPGDPCHADVLLELANRGEQ